MGTENEAELTNRIIGQKDAEINSLKEQIKGLSQSKTELSSEIHTLKQTFDEKVGKAVEEGKIRVKLESEIHTINSKFDCNGKSNGYLTGYIERHQFEEKKKKEEEEEDEKKKKKGEKHGIPRTKSSKQKIPTKTEKHNVDPPNWTRVLG
jgi:hypothetical protein